MPTQRPFKIAVLGRMLEHLGVQMYKRRDTAIAELIANCWDANAKNVWVSLPTAGYAPTTSTIVVEDDGDGMSDADVEDHYLVVGRNRRRDDAEGTPPARRVMGRKGIGKLAGFGIATKVDVTTWREDVATALTLDLGSLKLGEREMAEVSIDGLLDAVPADVHNADHGTRLVLRDLKHTTPPDVSTLREALARRFSRTVRGEMTIWINGEMLGEPTIDWELRVPAVDEDPTEREETFPDGSTVRYYYGFSKTVLASRELRGFTVLTHGKTAQSPPYFFDVETTASGQHGTKYLSGAVEADFLDEGDDDESDLVSTDRQEIDWESPRTAALLQWGAELTRRALREFAERRREVVKKRILADDALRGRLDRLDKPSRDHAMRLLGSVGLLDAEADKELELASNLIAAFEYRHFHDVIDQIDSAEDDPARLGLLLEHIAEWKALEGRAVLEVIRGRISIIDKFHALIVSDAPETAHRKGDENMHDLLADFPWLLHPEWQVLAEEKSISRQLQEWSAEDIGAELSEEERRQRYDFLALGDENRLIVIEIKRAYYAPTIDDIHRILKYRSNLQRGTEQRIDAVFISSKKFVDDVTGYDNVWLLSWGEVRDRTRAYYEHYRALLEGDTDHPDFARKAAEVARAREVLDGGAYRGEARRAAGLGPQDPLRGFPSGDDEPTEQGQQP